MYIEALAKLGIDAAHPGGMTLTKELLYNERINKSTSILEIGCGTGLTSELLYKEFKCQIVACDLHPLMVEKANQRFKKSKLPMKAVIANAECLPFENESFDFVISESVTTFTHIQKSLREYKRVLKPNGKLIAIEMCKANEVKESELKNFMNFYKIQQLFTIDKWKEELLKSSFSCIRVNPYKLEVNEDGEMINIVPTDQVEGKVYETFFEHIELVKKYSKKVFPCIIKANK